MNFFLYLIFLSTTIFASTINLSLEEKTYLENKKVIKMCVDPDWEPFEVINKNGKHEGIAADIIALIFKKINVDYMLIKTKDWDETLEFSKQKKCDILSFLNETPKRKEWLIFTEPIFKDPNVLVGRQERSYIDDISKETLSIALPRGTSMSEKFSKDFPNLTIIPTSSEAEAFKLVEERKADITLRSLIVTAFTIKKEGIFNLKIVGEPKGYENVLRIGILKDEVLLQKILNKAILKLSEKDIDEIINNQVKIKIEKPTDYTIAILIVAVLVILLCLIMLWNYVLRKKVSIEVEKNLKQNELLFQQKRKAELGELIANISHQWRNGLSNISSVNLHLMILCDETDEIKTKELQKYNIEIEKSIKFMSKTMEVFLNFYKDEKQSDTFDISKSIEEAMLFIEIPIKTHNITIEIIEKKQTLLKANKNEWIHIWLNLFTNSINQINKKNIKFPKITIIIDENQILYEDNCGGFEDEILEMIRNDRTKGLGLKMSMDILKKYHWKMLMENKNNGASFVMVK